LALPVRTRPGHWPDRSSSPSARPHRHDPTPPCPTNYRTTAPTTRRSGSASFSRLLGRRLSNRCLDRIIRTVEDRQDDEFAYQCTIPVHVPTDPVEESKVEEVDPGAF